MGTEQIRNSTAEGFVNINRAFAEIGIISRLDGMLRDRDIKPNYWVFDATEWTIGFPTPVRTRYVVAVSKDLLPDQDDQHFVGISSHESYGNTRGVVVGIGLSRHEMEKISTRYSAVRKSIGDQIPEVRPDWWTYDFKVSDLTHATATALKDQPQIFAEAFAFGDYDIDKTDNIGRAVFEIQEKDEEQPRRVWDEHTEGVEQAMRDMVLLIEQVAQRTQSVRGQST